jgi:hypothetical protein
MNLISARLCRYHLGEERDELGTWYGARQSCPVLRLCDI